MPDRLPVNPECLLAIALFWRGIHLHRELNANPPVPGNDDGILRLEVVAVEACAVGTLPAPHLNPVGVEVPYPRRRESLCGVLVMGSAGWLDARRPGVSWPVSCSTRRIGRRVYSSLQFDKMVVETVIKSKPDVKARVEAIIARLEYSEEMSARVLSSSGSHRKRAFARTRFRDIP